MIHLIKKEEKTLVLQIKAKQLGITVGEVNEIYKEKGYQKFLTDDAFRSNFWSLQDDGKAEQLPITVEKLKRREDE
jgi:hypothetical protein